MGPGSIDGPGLAALLNMARKSDDLPPMYCSMNLFTAAAIPDGRHVLPLSHRMTAVVLVPFDGYVVVGFFWKGELLFLIDRALGEA